VRYSELFNSCKIYTQEDLYKLLNNVATCVVEFDECLGENHGCQHICVNTLGGYKCDCRIGYELHSDGKRCEGLSTG
jgi:hypothetical protein